MPILPPRPDPRNPGVVGGMMCGGAGGVGDGPVVFVAEAAWLMTTSVRLADPAGAYALP